MVSQLLIQDVHNLIDDFVRAVVAEGQPCNFETLSWLWYGRGFSFLHWASEAPTKGLASTPPPNTLQLLYRGALLRLVQPSCVPGSSVPGPVRPDTPETATMAGTGSVQAQPHAGASGAGDQHHSNVRQQASTQQDQRSTYDAQMAVSDEPTPTAQPMQQAVGAHDGRPDRPEAGSYEHARSEELRCGSTTVEPVHPVASGTECQPAGTPPHMLCCPPRAQPNASHHQHNLALSSIRNGDHVTETIQHGQVAPSAARRDQTLGSNSTATPAQMPLQHSCGPRAHGAAVAPSGGRSLVDLTTLSSHPFITQVRRKHLASAAPPAPSMRPEKQRTPLLVRPAYMTAEDGCLATSLLLRQHHIALDSVSRKGGSCAANVDTARSMQRLDLRVFPQAQIAAVYVLYALFGTQPSKPASQIYVNPSHRVGLRASIHVMASHGARDGLAMLKALVAANAIVWGLVDCHHAGSRPNSAGFGVMPALARTAQTVTDNAIRHAAIHLRQLLPPNSGVQVEHGAYVGSLRRLVAAGVPVPDTMLRNLPEDLATKFAAAVANVRHPLATAVKKRKRVAEADADALGAELDEELQEDEPPPPALPATGGGLAAVMQASAERSRRRKLAEQQWRRQVGGA